MSLLLCTFVVGNFLEWHKCKSLRQKIYKFCLIYEIGGETIFVTKWRGGNWRLNSIDLSLLRRAAGADTKSVKKLSGKPLQSHTALQPFNCTEIYDWHDIKCYKNNHRNYKAIFYHKPEFLKQTILTRLGFSQKLYSLNLKLNNLTYTFIGE